tara:strand:+ start:50201 stop:52834 length:2634 start_codon:yes stop_codon:yes gene_type:complete
MPALASVVLAIALAAIVTPLVMLPQLLPKAATLEIGKAAPVTIRVSPLQSSSVTRPGSALAMVRGETVSPAQKLFAQQRPSPGIGGWATLLTLLMAAAFAWSSILRAEPRCAGLRQHLADAGLLILLTAGSLATLLLTPISLFALPVGAVAYLSAFRNSRACALAVATLSALTIGSMVPDAAPVIAILAAQSLVPALWLRRRSSLSSHVLAAAVASLVSLGLYALLYFAAWNQLPTSIESGLASWLCAGLGPFSSLAFAGLLSPVYTALRGDTSSRSLSRLEKLSQPLLRDLAQKAPGSWQHSLAMAKLAEAAGASIGADTQLLRVGAYYHDIGKVSKPRYFVENIPGTERSVHESVTPIDSCEGIVGHVSKGLELGRSAGLPERVLDFIRTHHGRGLLEYFWTKEQLLDETAGADRNEDDFRYPGHLPNSPETGILCICDAIEGATRPLKGPTPEELSDLVHHIVFGKVRTGQLAHSGLSLRDLRNVSLAITGALQTAHAPVTRKSASRQESSTAPGSARARPGARRPSIAGLSGIRLDSQDRPSSSWRHLPKNSPSGGINVLEAHAATESVAVDGTGDTALAVPDMDDLANVATEDLAVGTEETVELSMQAKDGAEDEAEDEDEDEAERANAATRGLRKAPTSPPAPPAQADQSAAGSEKAAEEEPAGESLTIPKTAKVAKSVPEGEASTDEDAEVDPKPAKAKIEKPDRDRDRDQDRDKDKAPALEIPAAEMPFLLTSLKRTGPPTPPPSRRNTIPLGKDELLIGPAPSQDLGEDVSQPTKRADSQDGLKPGEMVIGAPPATHPKRGTHEEKTALRVLPVPSAARRPEDRITEEQLILVPPTSWGDPTAPSTANPDVEATVPQTDRPGSKTQDD